MSSKVSSSVSDSVESTDMIFYAIMLALIVCMALYIAYDMDKRYASGSSSATVSSESTSSQKQASEPVIVNIEEVDTVIVKPVAVIPATQNTSAAVVVEQIEQKNIVTTAVIPVEETAPTADTRAKSHIWSPVLLSEPSAPGINVQAVAEPALAPAPTPVATASMPFAGSAMQAAEDIIAPAAATVETVTKTMTSAVIDAVPAAQAYNPYANPYPNNDYQPQPQYGNSYQNSYYQAQPQYGNPYQPEPQYNNPYANPYGPYTNMGSSDLYAKPTVEGENTATQQPAAQ